MSKQLVLFSLVSIIDPTVTQPSTEPFRPPAIDVSTVEEGSAKTLQPGTYAINMDGVPTNGAQYLRVAVDELEPTSGPPITVVPVRVNWTDKSSAPSSVSVPPGGEVRLFLPGTLVGVVSVQLVVGMTSVCRVSYAA